MRKYRSWLMGLGIGLIMGASMLQVILIAKDSAVIVTDQTLTREQLDEQARKTGLVLLTTDQLNAKVDEAVAAAVQTKVDENTPSPSKSVEPSSPDTTAPEVQKEVTLYIKSDMTLSEVANKLQELGIIKDANDFVTVASSISKKLSVGTAVFNGKPTYSQIMKELTRTKKD
jgi:hypothetical protein